MSELKHDDTSPYFCSLPSRFRKATLNDFYNDDGEPIIDKPYLLHSEHKKDVYWACRVRKTFTQENDFMIFMQNERVYVLAEVI